MTTTGLPLRNLTQLVDNYKTLVSEVVARNCSRDHFIVDFINEPDATGYLWEVGCFVHDERDPKQPHCV